MLEIVAVPAFSDNYLWLVHDPPSGETVAVDPGDATPLLAEAQGRGWTIGQVWNTHWHPDHSGGNERIKQAGATIHAPAAEASRIPGIDIALTEGDRVRIGAHEAEVWEVPGHTAGHIAYVLRDDGIAFVGDTLFAMGCGRLFEGTPEQMFNSLRRIASLPAETKLYCAHEYTLSNARFAAQADPGNQAIQRRLGEVEQARQAGEMTVPTTVGKELETNVFVRASDAKAFARLRQAKDAFR